MVKRRCVVLLLATACSGGTHPGKGPVSAIDLARAGVLRAGDLPEGYAAKNSALPAARSGCLATSVVAEAQGAEYVRNQVAVTSTASVATASADARAALEGLAKNGACLRELTAARLRGAGLEVTGFTATPEKIDLPQAYAFSTDVTATSPGGFAFTVHGYSVGAVVGATQVVLSVTKSADTGLTLADTTALLKVLTDRVAAASSR